GVNHLLDSRAEIALIARLISWFRARELFLNLTLIAVRAKTVPTTTIPMIAVMPPITCFCLRGHAQDDNCCSAQQNFAVIRAHGISSATEIPKGQIRFRGAARSSPQARSA